MLNFIISAYDEVDTVRKTTEVLQGKYDYLVVQRLGKVSK